jgi:hypothetical protein
MVAGAAAEVAQVQDSHPQQQQQRPCHHCRCRCSHCGLSPPHPPPPPPPSSLLKGGVCCHQHVLWLTPPPRPPGSLLPCCPALPRAPIRLSKLEISCPIKQHAYGTKGCYRCILVEQKTLSAEQFREIAEVRHSSSSTTAVPQQQQQHTGGGGLRL